VGGDLGDRYRGKLKSPNVKIAVDLVEKEIHDDSSKLHVEEDSNSKKARSIYVGQWDSIKEKMVWESMEKNKGLQGIDGAVMEGLHVGQGANTTVNLGPNKGAYVEEIGAVYGHMHEKSTSGNTSQLRWKRAGRIDKDVGKTDEIVGSYTKKPGHMGPKKVVHVETLGAVSGHMQDILGAENTTQLCWKRTARSLEDLSQIEDSITLTGKRRKESEQAENGSAGGKKNRHEVVASTEENMGMAVAVKQPRQVQ
jgi:hypothetical protein